MQRQILTLTLATVMWAGDAFAQGSWETGQTLPENPRHAILLPPTTFNNTWYPDGLILYLERSGTKAPFLWDPAGQSHVGQTGGPPNKKLFCSGHAFDGFGRVVMAGGWFGPGNCGNEQVALFDPVNLAATPFATQMVDKRFYPSCVTVADGTVWILGGNRWSGTSCSVRNPDVEWVDIHQGADPVVAKANVSLSPALQNYPVLFMLGGAVEGTCEILRKNQQNQWVWVFTAQDPVDPNDPGNLRHPRANPDCVLLADGTPFLVGGNEVGQYVNPIFTPEIFDAANGTWSDLLNGQGQPLNHQHPRAYHSVALLLRDGSVWVTGDDNPAIDQNPHPGQFVEIYKPWYFDQARPGIIWPAIEPVHIERNATFPVVYTLPPGRTFGYVALIALGSVTHSTNFSQRYVILFSVESQPGIRSVTPPPAAFAPPGPYMMVVTDDLGVPSVAEFVYLDF